MSKVILPSSTMGSNRGLVLTALDLAAAGLPVFPANAAKRPIVSRGFRAASTNPAWIVEQFRRATAERIGFPTGEVSGVDVLDVDERNNGHIWERANLYRFPSTRIHQSGSGGRHYLFRHVEGVRNSAGRVAQGVDIRGDGGYAIWWPVINDVRVAEWPSWLLPLVLPAPVEVVIAMSGEPIADRRYEGFRLRVLARVNEAADGAKHATLLRCGRALGGVAEAAGFSTDEAVAWLLEALPKTVKDWEGARRTARWAVEAGRANPLHLADRDRP